ncbi:hypothetical protein V8F20_011256 [Naviculisporaceae sp. PSN 640]
MLQNATSTRSFMVNCISGRVPSHTGMSIGSRGCCTCSSTPDRRSAVLVLKGEALHRYLSAAPQRPDDVNTYPGMEPISAIVKAPSGRLISRSVVVRQRERLYLCKATYTIIVVPSKLPDLLCMMDMHQVHQRSANPRHFQVTGFILHLGVPNINKATWCHSGSHRGQTGGSNVTCPPRIMAVIEGRIMAERRDVVDVRDLKVPPSSSRRPASPPINDVRLV